MNKYIYLPYLFCSSTHSVSQGSLLWRADERIIDEWRRIGKGLEGVSITFLILFVCYDVMLTE